ncbi:hypothetical protein [Undibacterium rugosum]|uniref:Uncharacterized protein n=1 Tax=Undibacterium rugosum TaxID=2762291 RepID=A0A923HYQ4_9BURK|nr:hypothetical protein [Undibacterium rugosum]MBC3934628.1 hypothetical protein [Undibacterium rugosum]MBR7777242.1 hypothetical protein [Undibacterium rugosum]
MSVDAELINYLLSTSDGRPGVPAHSGNAITSIPAHEFVLVFEGSEATPAMRFYLAKKINEMLPNAGFDMAFIESAEKPAEARLALLHPEAYLIVQALLPLGLSSDFAIRNIIQYGFAPIVERQMDLLRALKKIESLLHHGGWRNLDLMCDATALPKLTTHSTLCESD